MAQTRRTDSYYDEVIQKEKAEFILKSCGLTLQDAEAFFACARPPRKDPNRVANRFYRRKKEVPL